MLEEVLLFTASAQTSISPLTTTTAPYHSIGVKLTQTLIGNHLKIFYSSLMTSVPMRLVASCLRVLVGMVMQGVESAREIQQVFNFAYKPLEVFPNRTNTIQASQYFHILPVFLCVCVCVCTNMMTFFHGNEVWRTAYLVILQSMS